MKLRFFFLLFPLMLLGQSVTVSKTKKMFEVKAYKQAKHILKEALEETLNAPEIQELLADAHSYLKEWDSAIPIYQQLKEKQPTNAVLYYKYGGALGLKLQTGNKLQAFFKINKVEEAFLKAVTLDTSYIDAHWALVKLYTILPKLAGGSKQKALLYAKKLLKISEVDGNLANGFIYKETDNFTLAETYYNQALVVGKSKTCYQELINLYIDFKETQKAQQLLVEAARKYPEETFLIQLETLNKKLK